MGFYKRRGIETDFEGGQITGFYGGAKVCSFLRKDEIGFE